MGGSPSCISQKYINKAKAVKTALGMQPALPGFVVAVELVAAAESARFDRSISDRESKWQGTDEAVELLLDDAREGANPPSGRPKLGIRSRHFRYPTELHLKRFERNERALKKRDLKRQPWATNGIKMFSAGGCASLMP
jgi:hypothetical protein